MINKFFTKGWNIAYRKKEEKKFKIIKNNIGSWMADPFIIEENNTAYIFGEMYCYDRYKGSIGFCEIIDNHPTKWKKIISEKYHLSFPNIYKEGNTYYMYVESSDGKEFYRYKCIEFPHKWVKDNVYLDNVELVDTVLFDYNNEKMGFTYDISSKPKKLLLFTLKNGKVNFFDRNPISIDDASARPGGKNLIIDGKNIRVAQDCSKEYGGELVFLEFDIKNKKYIEKEVKRISVKNIKYNKGSWIGVHTYNESLNYEVIDLKFKKIVISSIIHRLINKIKGGVK